MAFRGVLSFWTAGEFSDDELLRHARAAAALVHHGFVTAEAREALIRLLAEPPPAYPAAFRQPR